jgi:hypothetical protein
VKTLRVERPTGGGLVITVTATVSDELSQIRILEYSLDGREWEPVFPEDGLYDAREERFRFEIDLADAIEKLSRAAGAGSERRLAGRAGGRAGRLRARRRCGWQ